jgi:DNA-binding response OmpR family regulator
MPDDRQDMLCDDREGVDPQPALCENREADDPQPAPRDDMEGDGDLKGPTAGANGDPEVAGQGSADRPVDVTAMPVILLVEDNGDFRFYLKDNLQDRYKVIEAANGREGWQKALSGHPQLILSDISMPFMDGIELTSKLKADKRTSHIPVILLTALTEEEQQLRGLGTGANDYITKPFNIGVLHAKIRNLLAWKERMQTTYTRQIKLLTAEPAVGSEDERLMIRIVSYLEDNLTSSQLSVESLSREMGMSRSSLYGKMLEITGEKPVEYIRSFKLKKAMALLERSDLTISEIAYQVGFSTPNYFARAFKAQFNMLPSEYVTMKKEKQNQ